MIKGSKASGGAVTAFNEVLLHSGLVNDFLR